MRFRGSSPIIAKKGNAMKKPFLALTFFLLLFTASAGTGLSMEKPRQIPDLPPDVQAAVATVIPSEPGDYFVVLKNGMTVLIRQNSEYDVVSAQVFVRAGSIYEGRLLTAGLSHNLEHIVAGGTTGSFTEEQAKERLKEMGGASNAYTTYDRTVYFIDTSSEHWKDALGLLISYVSDNRLDPKEVTREKSVIQQEFKLGENNPSRELWQLFMDTAYRIHPVRYPVIGYEDVFVRNSREDLEAYYAERYAPENIVMAIAGNVDPIAALKYVIEATKGFARKAAPVDSLPPEPPQTSPRRTEKELPIAKLTQAMIGFPSVDIASPDLYALDVLAILAGDGDTSRLHRRLKEKEKQVLSVDASNWTPSFVKGQFIISMDLPPDKWPKVMDGVEDELNRLKKELATSEELEKAKKKVVAAHVFGKETASEMASTIASSYFDTGDPYFDETYVEGIRRVTAEEVRRAANAYLDMGRMNVAVIKPPKEAKESASATEAVPAAPATAQASEPRFVKLNNGMKLLLKSDRTLPLVTIQLYGPGGLTYEKSAPPGISAFTAELLTAGTKTRSKQDIAKAIESVGGAIGSGSESNTYHVSIKVLKEDLDLALDILSDIVQNSQFPADEIEKNRQDFLLALQQRDESWQAEIAHLFKENYFKEHPYGHDRLGTPESIKALTRDEIVKFYHRMATPAGAVLAVYGDVDADVVQKRITEKFASWKAAPGSAEKPDLPNETEMLSENRVVEKKNQKTSAALLIGTNGVDLKSEDRPTLDVLDAILSGVSYPTGRLEDALRGGDQDLVYLVHAFPFYGVNAGFFGVITQTTLANLDKVQGIIMDNLNKLVAEPVSQQELDTGKNIVVTMHHMELESIEAQAQSATVDEVLGLGWNYDAGYIEKVKAVTAANIQDAAKRLFTHTLTVRTIPEHPVEVIPPHSDEPQHMHPGRP